MFPPTRMGVAPCATRTEPLLADGLIDMSCRGARVLLAEVCRETTKNHGLLPLKLSLSQREFRRRIGRRTAHACVASGLDEICRAEAPKNHRMSECSLPVAHPVFRLPSLLFRLPGLSTDSLQSCPPSPAG